MAKGVKRSELRELAERHRTVARLYDRLASQEELADSMRQYGTKLAELEADVARLRTEIRELERGLVTPAPAVGGV